MNTEKTAVALLPRSARRWLRSMLTGALVAPLLAAIASAGTTFSQTDNTATKLTVTAKDGKFTKDGTYTLNLTPNWTGTLTVAEANKGVGNDAITVSWFVTHTGSSVSFGDSMYASTKGQSKGTHEIGAKTKEGAHGIGATDSFKATLSYTVGGVGGWNMTDYTFTLTGEHAAKPGCGDPLSIIHQNTADHLRFTATGPSVKVECDEVYHLGDDWLGDVAIHRLETSSGTAHDQVNLSWSVFHDLTGSIYTDAMIGNAQTSTVGAHALTKKVKLDHVPKDDGADQYFAKLAYTIEPNGTEISNFSFSLQGDHADDGQFFKMKGELGGMLGSAMMAQNDLDLDGSGDLVVGSPFAAGALGSVKAHSSETGLTLWTRDGFAPGDLYGSAISTAGDVDGDGIADVAVGAPDPAGIGAVEVLSGRNGALLFRLNGAANGDGFGTAIAAMGDLDMDGVGDLSVGAPLANGCGVVRVFRGNGGGLLATYGTGNGGERYGAAIAAMGDVDSDGGPDLAVGAPGAGTVYFVSGYAGIHVFAIAAPGDFGAALASWGDVNDDSVADLIIGAPGYDNGSGQVVGAVIGMSGAFDHSLLMFAEGTVAGARLGASVAAAGDVDGDGMSDVIAGAPDAGSGAAYVYSAAGPSPYAPIVLRSLEGEAAGDRFGSSVAGIGDLDGDGLAEVVAGAPASDGNGLESGSAVIVRAKTGALHPGTGDGVELRTGVNSDADTDSLKYVTQLDTVRVEVAATNPMLAGMPAFLVIQLVDADFAPIALPQYPSIWFGLGQLMLIQFPLSASGMASFQLKLPAAPQSPMLAGTSLLMQGVVANPMAPAFYSTTDMHELRVF